MPIGCVHGERGMTLKYLSLLHLSVERFNQEFIVTNENPKKLMLGNKNEHYLSAHAYGDKSCCIRTIIFKASDGNIRTILKLCKDKHVNGLQAGACIHSFS